MLQRNLLSRVTLTPTMLLLHFLSFIHPGTYRPLFANIFRHLTFNMFRMCELHRAIFFLLNYVSNKFRLSHWLLALFPLHFLIIYHFYTAHSHARTRWHAVSRPGFFVIRALSPLFHLFSVCAIVISFVSHYKYQLFYWTYFLKDLHLLTDPVHDILRIWL